MGPREQSPALPAGWWAWMLDSLWLAGQSSCLIPLEGSGVGLVQRALVKLRPLWLWRLFVHGGDLTRLLVKAKEIKSALNLS